MLLLRSTEKNTISNRTNNFASVNLSKKWRQFWQLYFGCYLANFLFFRFLLSFSSLLFFYSCLIALRKMLLMCMFAFSRITKNHMPEKNAKTQTVWWACVNHSVRNSRLLTVFSAQHFFILCTYITLYTFKKIEIGLIIFQQ